MNTKSFSIWNLNTGYFKTIKFSIVTVFYDVNSWRHNNLWLFILYRPVHWGSNILVSNHYLEQFKQRFLLKMAFLSSLWCKLLLYLKYKRTPKGG